MKKDKHVNKLADQTSNQSDAASSCFSTGYLNRMADPTVASPFDKTAFPDQSSFSQKDPSHHQSGSPELCEKIRSSLGHFTEEFKEKFIKKKNRSPNLFVNRRIDDRSNQSSDQEEGASLTRIQIGEESEFSSSALSQNSFGQGSQSSSQNYQNSPCSNLGPSLQCNSISQNSLFESARSPFVNRALPPLPRKAESNPFNRQLKASNSRSDSRSDSRWDSDRNQPRKECPDDRPFFKSNTKFNQRKSSDKISKFSQSSHQLSDDSDDDEQIPTNCFKFNRENKDNLKKCSAKIKNEIRHFLPKKYSHPPPHLHSKQKIVQQFFDDEEEEDGEEASSQPTGSSLINLNGNLIHNTTGSASIAEPLQESQPNQLNDETRKMMDYAESIEKVKDCGWYWGSISGEKAEKLLEKEPEGSFIVRDSSDENYIFSLTFKLNGDIIHVRIEHNQGNFSFGSFQKFKSKTIVDFIDQAVEYSRSGRYLFFLHRLPVVGPMRVQLLNPVSRFRNVQSLRHLCRFIILKRVRRDLLPNLPLPDRLIKYLNATNYFVESTSFA